MKVGVGVGAGNPKDWDRVMAGEYDKPQLTPDANIISDSISVGDMVEDLGFDSIWATEHYGTPYAMTGPPLQWLAFWAGRTKRVGVGTGVIVLPWHQPMRLVHELAMLDHLLQGRPMHLGIGRGVAEHEYRAFGVPPEEGRERFVEMVEILKASEQPRFSYSGKYYQLPETSVRPVAPHRGSLFTNLKGAFNTPTSMELAAELGLGQIFITGASLEVMKGQVAKFNAIRATKGLAPNQPTVSMNMFCSKDQKAIDRALEQRVEGLMTARNHYALYAKTDFTQRKGFEDYAKFFAQGGHTTSVRDQTSEDGALIGTPEQIIDKIGRYQEGLSMEYLTIGAGAGGTRTVGEIKASLELFAKEVLPHVDKMATPLHEHSRGTEADLKLQTGMGGAV